jgi:PIN domain nuclease of toxin-antitoxin system
VILLDTHAWVWHVAKPEKLSKRAAEALEQADRLAVSAISCREVATLVSKGRLVLDRPTREWLLQALAQPRIELAALSPTIAARSAELGDDFHGDPADRILVATALERRMPLVTRDKLIRASGVVRCVW